MPMRSLAWRIRLPISVWVMGFVMVNVLGKKVI